MLAVLLAAAMTLPPRAAAMPSLSDMVAELADGLVAPPDPIEKRVELARDCARKKDVLGWCLAVMPEKFYKPFCHELHGYFVSVRNAVLTSTVAPRGHAKTLVRCKGITMFQALEEPKGYDFYLNIQATHEKGVNVNFSIKNEFESNPVIRALYGDVRGEVKWTDEVFMLKNGVIFRGAGVGDSIRGMMFLDRRPKYTIVDDLYDEDDIGKPKRIEVKNEWYWSSLYPGREKGKATSFHVQGTVAGENDLMLQMGEMAKTDPEIKHREFSAIKPDGTPLWIELNSAEDLEKERRRMGDATFSRENLGDRSARKNSIIKPSYIASWRQPPSAFRCDTAGDPYRLIEVMVGIDPSVGKKQNQGNKEGTGDPAAYARIWKLQPMLTPGALPVYFIDSIVNERLGMDDRIKMAQEMVSTSRHDRPVRRIRIETISGFDDIGTLIARAVGVLVEKVPSVPDKMLNLEKKEPFFLNGRVFINENLDPLLLREVEKQLTTNQPVHDDVRDAIFLCLDDSRPSMSSWVRGA